MVDIRLEQEQYRKQLEDYYKRENTLTDEEYEDMKWIEGYLQNIELRELNERGY